MALCMRWRAAAMARSTARPRRSLRRELRRARGLVLWCVTRLLWCVTRQDLFAPALAQFGLVPDRVI